MNPPTVALSDFVAADSKAEVRIGRQPANTIVFENPDVSGWHARVTRNPEGCLLVEDLGSTNGTYVNGQPITRSALSFADQLRVGSTLVQLSDPRIAALLLHVERRPPKGQAMTLGSAPGCDVVVRDATVAPQHATLTDTGQGIVVRDLGSPNGTFLDGPSFRITEARVGPSNVLILGTFPLPISVLSRVMDAAHDGAGRGSVVLADALREALESDRPVLTVGREPDNDLVLAHPTVSSHHARFTRMANGTLRVEDFGSSNGTYINGHRVGSETAGPGDVVAVGAVTLVIGAGGRIEGAQSKVRLDLVGLGLVVKDQSSGKPRRLLERVNLSIFPGELVGMLGPSGAGKTTLLMAVLGLNRPTEGGVLLNGKPLFQQYEAFRTNVGYVPQDDIVHPELTVREALYYACKLRLPVGISRINIDASIDQTLKEVGLWEQRNLQIGNAEDKVLSGGQRRRVNLAVELVTDPALLILDEPTSGLSWTDAADVITTLRALADGGRTIVLTIHQPDYQEYERFDTVAIMGRGGKILFYGPPRPDSYIFFGAEQGRPRDMFDHVEHVDPDEWRRRFEKTETHRRFVVERGPKGDAQLQAPPPKPRSRSSLRQWPLVLARSLRLTLRRRGALAMLLLQAPILGLLIGLTIGRGHTVSTAVFGCSDMPGAVDMCTGLRDGLVCDLAGRLAAAGLPVLEGVEARIPDPRTGLIAILMALFLPMVIASSNVLVSERAIYERERLAGLNIVPYLLARFSVLVLLGGIVSLLHLAIAVPMLDLRGAFLSYLWVGVLTTSSASAMGLALSAAVRRPASALWGINMLIIPQLLFAGGIVRLDGFTRIVSWATSTRYGLEALTNIDLRARAVLAPCQVERFMTNLPGFHANLGNPVLFAAVGAAVITLISLTLAAMLLRLKDN